MTQIKINLNTPNGPIVEYGPDDDAQAVELEVPEGWRVDWETPAYKLANGRYRAPLVKLPSEIKDDADCAADAIGDHQRDEG